jgi:pimeloyl-ACP methyl ester carboxylesterase
MNVTTHVLAVPRGPYRMHAEVTVGEGAPEQFPPTRPAFWRIDDDLLGTVLALRRRIGELRRLHPPVQVVFGAHDRYLGPRVARRFAGLFPNSELHLLCDAGHYVQVDETEREAGLILGILGEWRHATNSGYAS